MTGSPAPRPPIPDTPADRVAAFLAAAEYALLQARHGCDGDTSESLISTGCYYAPRLLSAVKAALRLHHETAGKCATCLGYWPCGEWLALSRELLSGVAQ